MGEKNPLFQGQILANFFYPLHHTTTLKKLKKQSIKKDVTY